MLDPQNRTVLLDALVPPEGFVFTEGIGTTYTLDLVSLLSVPLAFTLFEWEDAQGQPTSNPILLLEALRRHISRMTIYCQAGRIALPARSNPLFGYLEDSVVAVDVGEEGIFHPKLWALRYLNEETMEVRYRVLSLSRNLTGDDCWDISLALEGPLVARKNAYATNHPLGDFISALPGLAIINASESVTAQATRMAEELRRVDFAGNLPEPFEEVSFHPMGIEGHRRRPLPASWSPGLVISPFIDRTQAEYLAHETEGSVLISRAEELDKLPSDSLKGWSEVLILNPSAEAGCEPGEQTEPSRDGPPHGLHAKLYVCDNGWNAHLFVGSANATTAAFERNVEFLIELVGKKSRVGVAQFLSNEDGQASLRSLLNHYEPPAVPTPEDSLERSLEERLDAARLGMARAQWKFVAVGPEVGPWKLNLVRPEGASLYLPDGVQVRVWPVTLPELTTSHDIDARTTRIDFPEVGAASLTMFLACEAEATIDSASAKARFVLRIPLEGAPTGRREAILRVILDDPHKVLRFLQFLLDDAEAGSAGELEGSYLAGGSSMGRSQEQFVLLESLLRALAHEPARLDQVQSLLRELGDDAEGRARVPAGLLDVWPAIWAAREAAR